MSWEEISKKKMYKKIRSRKFALSLPVGNPDEDPLALIIKRALIEIADENGRGPDILFSLTPVSILFYTPFFQKEIHSREGAKNGFFIKK